MARYLITGVAGFIGSWVARELVSRGDTVSGLDNLSTGSLGNLEGIEHAVQLLHADLRNPAALDAACRGVDAIFHLAAIESTEQSIEDPLGTSHVNLDGTIQLIAAAQKAKVKRIVFGSSAAVYGNEAKCPTSEDAALNPLSPYASQKLGCEQYLMNATAVSGIETVSLRYFNVFGPRQSSESAGSGVIAQFTRKMLSTDQGGPVIYGNGEQTRDFVYISDAVQAAILAMSAPASMVSGKVFNVGSGRSKSVRLAFETLACMIGFTGEPRFVHARPFDCERSTACVDAAFEAFGYRPVISFADGLYKTISWYRQRSVTRQAKPAVERRRVERNLPQSMRALAENTSERHIDAHKFARAVQNNELELFYQPVLDLRLGQVIGVEALLRWRCGNRLLTPSHFIHLADQKGLTPHIGGWVLNLACAQAVELQRTFRPGLRLAVNISSMQVEQAGLLKLVDAAISGCGMNPTLLDLEVIERTLVRDCATTQQNLQQLRRRGISIAVDDFGTGASNMNYLHHFPIDCLKIDQSFVQHRGHARVLNGMVAFAKTLGVRTVAEGVESAYQLNHVTEAGCDHAQGFHIGRPVPSTHLIQCIEAWEAQSPAMLSTLDRGSRRHLPQPSEPQADVPAAETN